MQNVIALHQEAVNTACESVDRVRVCLSVESSCVFLNVKSLPRMEQAWWVGDIELGWQIEGWQAE